MTLSRRQFLQRTGLLTAGSLLTPGWAFDPLVRRAMAASLGDRYFVVIKLDGGNDGLNTVVPLADGDSGTLRTIYEQSRSAGSTGLRLSLGSLSGMELGTDPSTNTPLALHPAMTPLKGLWDAGHVAIIQGCGYPNPNLSHAGSSQILERGDPLGVIAGSNGWFGRYLTEAGYGATDLSSVNVRPTIAPEFYQTATNVLALSELANLSFPYDGSYPTDAPFKDSAFAAIYAAAAGAADPVSQFFGNAGLATRTASQAYPSIDSFYDADRPTFANAYPYTGPLGRDLREVAKVIYAAESGLYPTVNARFFEVRLGGFDTHASQGGTQGRHADLLGYLSSALALFHGDLADMASQSGSGSVADKTLILCWSEFGRRIVQNDSGTDHGSLAPMFVVGGPVHPGLYGNHPALGNLDPNGNTIYSQALGDPARATDIRDVFGTILRHWLDLPDPASVFPPDLGNAGSFWTTPNFDVPFLG